jgi:hypothetical protein
LLPSCCSRSHAPSTDCDRAQIGGAHAQNMQHMQAVAHDQENLPSFLRQRLRLLTISTFCTCPGMAWKSKTVHRSNLCCNKPTIKAQLTSTPNDSIPIQMQESPNTSPVRCPKQSLCSSCHSCCDNPNKQTTCCCRHYQHWWNACCKQVKLPLDLQGPESAQPASGLHVDVHTTSSAAAVEAPCGTGVCTMQHLPLNTPAAGCISLVIRTLLQLLNQLPTMP